MRISLLNPNLSGDVSILDIGLTYLATYMNERTGHKAQIIDFTFRRKKWKEHLHAHIKEFKPDAVGITCTSLYTNYIREMALEIKQVYGIPIICGGYHASLMPEEVIEWANIDALCIGDGEYVLTEYLDALEQKRPLDGIAGLWAKQDGGVIKNPLRERIQDIDSLPVPNYDLWEDIDEYLFFNQLLYFMGTRGCPYSCSYCSELPIRVFIPGNHFRKRDPRAFAREIKLQWEKYKNRGMHLAHSFDPVFTIDKKWLADFADEYGKLGLNTTLPMSCFTRGDLIDIERVELMVKANIKVARIGFESGNPFILREVYEKNITNDQYKEAAKLLQDHGIAITGYFILGGPGEDMKTMQDTFNLARALNVSRPVFFIYQPLPKTKALEKLASLGSEVDLDKLKHIDCLHHGSAMRSAKLAPWQIQYFQYKCFVYFVGQRVLRLIWKQHIFLFINFVKYFIRARKRNIPLWYTVGYFLICCEENALT